MEIHVRINRPHLICQYSNLVLRLSGQTSILLYVVIELILVGLLF